MKTIIIIASLLIQLTTFGQADTIKVCLKVNNEPINDPSKEISLFLRTKEGNRNCFLRKDLILLSNPIVDSSEIIVIYKSNELGRCFRYAPKALKGIKGLTIEIFTSRKEIRKSLVGYVEDDIYEFRDIKSILVISTRFKRGEETTCTVKNWK